MHAPRPTIPIAPPPGKPGKRGRLQQQGSPVSARRLEAPVIERYNQFNETNPRLRSLLTASRRVRAENINPVVPNPPMSPEQALHYYRPLLTEYEEKEIVSFPEIYFVGKYHRKITPDYLSDLNYGFDDDEHNANLIVGDHLAYRFEILATFGAGAFGQVIRCFDHKNKCDVACKVVVNTEQMHDQGKVEAQILAIVNRAKSRYIVRAFDYFIFRGHICITFEILGPNLFELCQTNEYKPLPAGTARLFALQMLNGLEICHRNGIVHCDIKPENVLLVRGSQTLVKLIDFGSSCFAGFQKYDYIQSRFYRAPEVMIGIQYGPPMDIWSTALVVIEMLIGRPLWPGEDELEQLWMITGLLGPPPAELVAIGKRRDEFWDDDLRMKAKPGATTIEPGSMDLTKVLDKPDPHLVDFLTQCLTWDPADRILAATALQHPWIQSKEFSLPGSLKGSRLLPELMSGRKVYV